MECIATSGLRATGVSDGRPTELEVEEDLPTGTLVNWLHDNCLISDTCFTHQHAQLEGHEEELIKMNGLHKQLEVMWGLPPTRRHLRTEISASYACIMEILSNMKIRGPESSASQIRVIVRRTMVRVYHLCFGQDPKSTDDISILAQELATKLNVLGDLGSWVALLACVFATCLLLGKKSTQACQLLDNTTQLLQEQHQGKTLQSNAHIIDRQIVHRSTNNHSDHSLVIGGIVRYLRLCAFCQTQEWPRCVKFISGSTDLLPEKLFCHIQYIGAYCLYHSGNYPDAMATSEALMRTSPDGSTSTIFNLIGCCLRHMDKPHMALQQLRNAIAASSNVPAYSLFNASVVYRELGENDAEIESLGLLLKVLDKGNDDQEENKEEVSHLGPAVILLPSPGSHDGTKTSPMQEVDYMTVLYTLAKRNLDLGRNDKAAERYLDLLSVLVHSPVIVGGGCHGSHILLPSAQTIYLEAGTALLRVDRLDEALAVCDQLLMKSTLVVHADDSSSHDARGNLEETPDGEIPKVKDDVNSRRMECSGGGDAGNVSEMRTLTGVSSRKRRREASSESESHIEHSGTKEDDDDDSGSGCGRNSGRAIQNEGLDTSHAMVLQAKCLHKQGRLVEALEVVSNSLKVVQTYCIEEVETDSRMKGDVGGDDKRISEPLDEDSGRPKRRRIEPEDEEKSTCSTGSSADNPPTRTAVLKSYLYHLRSEILIGQNKPTDAMRDVLQSLFCLPANLDTLKTHAVILEKLGRKSEAVKAWAELKETKASKNTVDTLW